MADTRSDISVPTGAWLNLYTASGVTLGVAATITNKGSSTPAGTVISWVGKMYAMPIPAGYWPCDGTTINSIGSVLHGKKAPDTRGRVSVHAPDADASLIGLTFGFNTQKINQTQLPNVTLYSYGTGVPSGSVYVAENYACGGNSIPVSTRGWSVYDFASIAGTGSFFARTDTRESIQNASGYHAHSASFSGNTLGITSTGALNTQTQTDLDMRQPSCYVTQLIKL
jgi:microcystin-dependent protein